jgi:cytidylate kinase
VTAGDNRTIVPAVATVVTLSAPYGTGGSRIGPAVAERLGLRFLDRAIPVAVAESLAVPLRDAIAHDDRREAGIGRALAALALSALPYGALDIVPGETGYDEHVFRERTEQVIRSMAETTGGVVLGRAGAIVLAAHPSALHVRLDGPVEARIAAVLGEGIDEATARRQLDQTDRARDAYVRHFYRCDAHDRRLYHLVVDSTALDHGTCVDLIVTAAKAKTGALAVGSG